MLSPFRMADGLQANSISGMTDSKSLCAWSRRSVYGFAMRQSLQAAIQFRLAGQFDHLNADLEDKNALLADVSDKISKYLSPQVFRSILLG